MSKRPARQSNPPERFSQLQFQPGRQQIAQTEDDNNRNKDNGNTADTPLSFPSGISGSSRSQAGGSDRTVNPSNDSRTAIIPEYENDEDKEDDVEDDLIQLTHTQIDPSRSQLENSDHTVSPSNEDGTTVILEDENDLTHFPHTQIDPSTIWAIYTDGSFTRETNKCGWGVVIVSNGGLTGPSENEGTEVTTLGASVAVNNTKKNLRFGNNNQRSNNTAELSAIGESILYLLDEFNKQDRPPLTKIVFRPDSQYAINCITGCNNLTENASMINDIRRHYKDLKSLCSTKHIIIEWCRVEAHSNKRWNDRADELAKYYASAQSTTFKRAQARNPRTPVNDDRGIGFRHAQRRDPLEFQPPIDNSKIRDGKDYTGGDLLEFYADTPIHLIPPGQIGILCSIVVTKKLIYPKNIPMIRNCFNVVLKNLESNKSSELQWRKFLFLPRVLFTPEKTASGLTLKDKCNLILNDDWSHFPLKLFALKNPTLPGQKTSKEHDKARLRRAKSLLRDGEIARSYQALQRENFPTLDNGTTYEKLKKLHPERPPHSILPNLPDNLANVHLSTDEVKATIKKTKYGVTNCPITSLRYELLKALMGKGSDVDEQDFISSLTNVINDMANAKVPKDTAQILRSTQAIAGAKKNNGIRPIGLRDGFANLCSKTLLKHIEKETLEFFDGYNDALAGSKKMDELIALLTYANLLEPSDDRLFIDFSNAFNKIDRKAAADAIIEHCPQLAKYFYLLYEEDTFIWLKNKDDNWTYIHGSQGGVQGDVLMPIVFGFAAYSLCKRLKEHLASSHNSVFGAFLDDFGISSKHEKTVEALLKCQQYGPELGLEINYEPNKTVVLLGKCDSPTETQTRMNAYIDLGLPMENIKVHPDNEGPTLDYGYVHLGIPQGSVAYQEKHLQIIIDKFIESGKCDEQVEEIQAKWVYLLWIIRQKFPFWFRHMSPSITAKFKSVIENHVRSKFEDILGQKTTNAEFDQVCLPGKQHGMGLNKPEDVMASAYSANVSETGNNVKKKLTDMQIPLELVVADEDTFHMHEFENDQIKKFVQDARQVRTVLTKAAESIGATEKLIEVDHSQTRQKQKAYSEIINQARIQEMSHVIEDHGNDIQKATFLSNNGSFAGAFLHQIPKDRTSTLSNLEFRTACKLRLGMTFPGIQKTCCCKDNHINEPFGTHLFSCNEFKHLAQSRHDAIQNDIMQLGQHAMKRVQDSGLGNMITQDGRKGDLLFYGMGKNNSNLVVDITIANATSPHYLPNSSITEKFALNFLEKGKYRKYSEHYRQEGIDFMPLALESHGAVSDTFLKFFKKLANAAAEVNEIPYCIMVNYWQKRMSTTLQKYNSKIMQYASLKIAKKTGRLREDDIVHLNTVQQAEHFNF